MRILFTWTILLVLVGGTGCTPRLNNLIDVDNALRINTDDVVEVDLQQGTVSLNEPTVGVNTNVEVGNTVNINFDFTFEDFIDLDGDNLFNDELGNCMPYGAPQPWAFSGSSSNFIDTQPWAFSGSTSGFLSGQPWAFSGSSSELSTDSTDSSPTLNLTEFSNPADIGILIVDDFGGDPTALAPFDSAQQAGLESTFDSNHAATWPLHGPTVMNHLNVALASTGAYTLETLTGNGADWQHATGKRLVVRAVDFSAASSSEVAARIEREIAVLREHGITNVVVNMSFAIVPCSVWFDYVEHFAEFATIEDYAEAIYDKNEGAIGTQIDISAYGIDVFLPKIILKITTPVNPERDPLFKMIERQAGVVFVASAGNYGSTFSTYPAAWRKVVSVSAADLETSLKADYSNDGEVMAAGGAFVLELYNGNTFIPTTIAYRGTSFAAPGVSAFIALDLASGGHCVAADGTPLLDGVGLNVALEQAVAERCK